MNGRSIKSVGGVLTGIFCVAAMSFSPEDAKPESQDIRETRIREQRINSDPNCFPERYTQEGLRDCSPAQ